MYLSASKKEPSYTRFCNYFCNFQALPPCHQQWPGNPGAGKQTSLFTHNPHHSPCATYQPLIQSRTPCPICHAPPLAALTMCFCRGLFSSTAKASRKCLLCVRDLHLGSCSSVTSLALISSGLCYSLLNDRGKLLFFCRLPVELHLEAEERALSVNVIDLYFSLFHHTTH